MSRNVHCAQAFARQEHTRFRCAAQLGDILRVSRKRSAGKSDGFLIQWRSHHRVRFSAQTEFGRHPHIFKSCKTAAAVQLAKAKIAELAQRGHIHHVRLEQRRAGRACGSLKNAPVSDHYPVRQWAISGSARAFRITSAPIPEGSPIVRTMRGFLASNSVDMRKSLRLEPGHLSRRM